MYQSRCQDVQLEIYFVPQDRCGLSLEQGRDIRLEVLREVCF